MGESTYFWGNETLFSKIGRIAPPGKGKAVGKGDSDQKLNIPFLVLHLRSKRAGAVGAKILILIPFRQNEQEALAHGNGLPAARAEKGARLKLVISGLWLCGRRCMLRVKNFLLHVIPLYEKYLS
jgi:hypothetical protein